MIPHVVSINISRGGIPKLPVPSVRVMVSGLEGDGHNHAKHNTPLQAVCLQDIEEIEALDQCGHRIKPGEAGENLTVKGLGVNELPIGTKLKFSSGVVLEITRIRKPCYVMDAIHPQLKHDALGRHGMYARVIDDGILNVKDEILRIFPA